MQTLTITKDNALKAYNGANTELKEVLQTLLGKENFEPQKITERVKTLQDACDVLGRDIDDLFDNAEDDYERAEIAIKTFAEALREGKPASECFYYPYFYRSSGGGFSYYGCGYGLVYSDVGARLRVNTAEKAQHLGKCMENEYKTYLNGK